MPSFSCQVRSKQLVVDPNRSSSNTFEDLISHQILELKQDIVQGTQKPFKEIIDATSGDPSSCGQTTITFIRQVSALCCLPELLDDVSLPDDVKTRAQLFMCHHNIDQTGIEIVRYHVAQFLQKRDFCPADHSNIILVPGLSASIKLTKELLSLHSDGLGVGVLAPIPQFPPISALLAEHGLQIVHYALNEGLGWSIDKEELERSLAQGKTFCSPRAILVINPGFPTGQILSRTNIEDIIKFAERENLVVVAFEIFQGAVHDDNDFISLKKVLFEMADPASNVELLSIMMYSGDFTMGPGLQNGFIEFYNVNEAVKNYIKSSISTFDSSPICSQIALDCIINPPKPEEPSYPVFVRESVTFQTYPGVLAKTTYNYINRIPGLSCHPVQAGHCAYVKVDIPLKAVEFAKSINLCPSTFYILEMLKNCGVLTEPGEKYGQSPGSYYFKMSFLMPEVKLNRILRSIKDFQFHFMKKFIS